MDNETIASTVTWHLECAAFSAAEIMSIRPPADRFKMRMHYSLYAANLLGAVDAIQDALGPDFETAIESALPLGSFSGEQVFGYLRELRNGVVHRGVDLTAGGELIGELVCALAPTQVTNRGGKKVYFAPTRLLVDLFQHSDQKMKPILEEALDSVLSALSSTASEDDVAQAHDFLESVGHMPEWAKQVAKQSICAELITVVRRGQRDKLRCLLNLPFGFSLKQ
ncbi:hypothetical protein C4J96_3879 [Pseudomonas orientalis]|uniref:hypothetical protein n=1 Tax=Pseudomonas orientalis TaxID=76758 RepID=UPI000F57929F|nr:hypothetical protein [Pseudomonas orientalis]AZE95978.1 hypothetical protein C4J96_3879 [Pseudomonas orientalis]